MSNTDNDFKKSEFFEITCRFGSTLTLKHSHKANSPKMLKGTDKFIISIGQNCRYCLED